MLKMSEYANRRKELMQKIGPDGIVILPAAEEILRNGDATYPFRQNSDFYYLTGFTEPDSVLVLMPKRKGGEYLLFTRLRDRSREIWDGPRAGIEGACNDFLANEAFAIDEFETMLPDLLAGRESIYYGVGIHPAFDKKITRALNKVRGGVRRGLKAPGAIIDVTTYLHEMRLFKSPAERAMMQKAIDVSVDAHLRAMSFCEPSMYEYQLEAELLFQFKRQNTCAAYTPIVGAGKNSCILHYVLNQEKIVDGDVILIDAGAEYHNYGADLTRTFPANGRFSAEQRDIYEIVLAAQLAAINNIKPGMVWTNTQDVILKTITQGLLDLGILKGTLSDLIETKAYFPFYMHGSGHYLGLDTHDVGNYKIDNQWRTLKPGMLFTVEPGIYISADIEGVPERFHHIGVRIEDNVFVTENGCDVLSAHLPKKIADIEAVMA